MAHVKTYIKAADAKVGDRLRYLAGFNGSARLRWLEVIGWNPERKGLVRFNMRAVRRDGTPTGIIERSEAFSADTVIIVYREGGHNGD